MLVTGDNPSSARAAADKVGIEEIRTSVLPGEKVEVIVTLKRGGRTVAMVGDGINDTPALAAADMSMAMSTGTDVAMQVASITLMRGDPLLVPQAIDISRRIYRKIRQNLL